MYIPPYTTCIYHPIPHVYTTIYHMYIPPYTTCIYHHIPHVYTTIYHHIPHVYTTIYHIYTPCKYHHIPPYTTCISHVLYIPPAHLPGDDLILQGQQEVVGGQLVGSAAPGRGAVQREHHQAHQVTRGHAQPPLVVRLLGTHQAQRAVVAVLSVQVEGHGWGVRHGTMLLFSFISYYILIHTSS